MTGFSKGSVCIDSVGIEGKVIELSWYGTRESTISLGGDFHYRRKQIISSQVGVIPSAKTHRWDYKRRKQLVFNLLKNPVFDQHISAVIPFEESPQFFEELRTKPFAGIGYIIEY